MSSDTARILQELEVVTTTLVPDSDVVKLKHRYEEVVSNYDINRRTPVSLENDLEDKINIFISAKTLEGLSPLTIGGYEHDLIQFKNFVNKPAIAVSTPDIRSYLSSNQHLSSGTIQKKLSVLRTFFSWLVDEEILIKNPTRKIKSVKQPKRLPKAITSTELEMIRDSCVDTRERAMIEVMYSTGCRLSEISNMKMDDVDWITGVVCVIGKGNKERTVYLNSRSKFHLNSYLRSREHDDDTCEYLFTTSRRPYRQLKNKSIQDMIRRIASRTEIDKNITPHVFRHTMATLAMENGIELGDLQQLLGHESANTTLRYAQVNENRKQQAHKRFVQ